MSHVSFGGRTPVLTVLGSGTGLPDAHRHSAAHHLALGRPSLLLDCGPGTVHGLALHGVDWTALTHVAVTHYHNDHVGDLAALAFALKGLGAAARRDPLTLIGPGGFTGFLDRLAAALGSHVLDPGFDVVVREVGPGKPLVDPAGFTLECRRTHHTEEALAYRISGDWGAVAYTGDTGPVPGLADFLSGCDVLVAECALTDPPSMDGHLSPALLAELASVARPDLLLLTHVYPDQTPAQAAERVSAGYDGAVMPAHDGMRVRLAPAGPVVDPAPAPG